MVAPRKEGRVSPVFLKVNPSTGSASAQKPPGREITDRRGLRHCDLGDAFTAGDAVHQDGWPHWFNSMRRKRAICPSRR
jgi:hypothetical protein